MADVIKNLQQVGGVLTQATRDALGQASLNLQPIAADGAINPHVSGAYIITKATAAALTLAAPTLTDDDGVTIFITSPNNAQHVLTATGLIQDGAGNVNKATWPANAGGSLELVAYQGKWIVGANNNCVVSA